MDHDKTNIKTVECHDEEMGGFAIKYGTSKLEGNEHAYVTVTVESNDFGGCMHELVLKHAPHLKPLVELHLTAVTGEPMHYISNAAHWWGLATGTSQWDLRPGETRRKAAEHFRTTVLYGALPSDKNMPQPEDDGGNKPWGVGIQRILEHRRDRLRVHTQTVLDNLMS